jgi:hypothetical protein
MDTLSSLTQLGGCQRSCKGGVCHLDLWAPGVVLELERQRKAQASFRMELKQRGARARHPPHHHLLSR